MGAEDYTICEGTPPRSPTAHRMVQAAHADFDTVTSPSPLFFLVAAPRQQHPLPSPSSSEPASVPGSALILRPPCAVVVGGCARVTLVLDALGALRTCMCCAPMGTVYLCIHTV